MAAGYLALGHAGFCDLQVADLTETGVAALLVLAVLGHGVTVVVLVGTLVLQWTLGIVPGAGDSRSVLGCIHQSAEVTVAAVPRADWTVQDAMGAETLA